MCPQITQVFLSRESLGAFLFESLLSLWKQNAPPLEKISISGKMSGKFFCFSINLR